MRLSFVWWGAGRWRGGSQLREASALSKPLERSPLTRWRSWCLFCVLSMRPSARSPVGPVSGIPPAAGRLARAGLLSEPDKGLRASACHSTRTAAASAARAAWSGPAGGPSTLTSRAVLCGHRARRGVPSLCGLSMGRACPTPSTAAGAESSDTRESPWPCVRPCSGGRGRREQENEMSRLVAGDQCWDFTRVARLTRWRVRAASGVVWRPRGEAEQP